MGPHHRHNLLLRQPGFLSQLEPLELVDGSHGPDFPPILVQHVLGRARALPGRDLILLARGRLHAVVAGDEPVVAARLDAVLLRHALGQIGVWSACNVGVFARDS
jgi:hypothetical protein